MKTSRHIWIRTGYERFGKGGTNALLVEQLAQTVGKSKSSFYHHFGSTEIFLEALFEVHRERVLELAEKENQARGLFPDLVLVLSQHANDLLFSRSLRIQRMHPGFEALIQWSDEQIGPGFLALWQREVEHLFSIGQIQSFLKIALDNFYLQMTPESISTQWLNQYLMDMRIQLAVLARRPLDGSV